MREKKKETSRWILFLKLIISATKHCSRLTAVSFAFVCLCGSRNTLEATIKSLFNKQWVHNNAILDVVPEIAHFLVAEIKCVDKTRVHT